MAEYRVRIKLEYEVVRYIEAENETEAENYFDFCDDILLPENGTDIVDVSAELHRK